MGMSGIDGRNSAMCFGKLNGKIEGDYFNKMAGQWHEKQRRLQHNIDRHEEAEQSFMGEGVQKPELDRNAQALFERPPAKSADCSASCFRTAVRRMARWPPPSSNPLISSRKLRPLRSAQVRTAASILRKT